MEYDFTVIIRKTRGDDIDAACGQLAEMLSIVLNVRQ